MKPIKYISVGLLIILLASSIVLIAQYTGQSATTLVGHGALPVTCAVGDTAFRIDATAGSNWFGCSAPNSWVQLGGAGGTGTASVTTIGSLPGTCTNGSTFNFTDSLYQIICNPANTFNYFYSGYFVTPPPSAGWSWDNQTTSTINSTNGYEYAKFVKTSAVNSTWRYRAQPATPYSIKASLLYDATGVISSDGNNTTALVGIGFRESGTGKLVVIYAGADANSTAQVKFDKWTTSTNFSAAYTATTSLTNTNPLVNVFGLQHLAIYNDGTNLSVYLSKDGIHWHIFGAAHLLGDFFTAAPNEVCFGSYCNLSSPVVALINWTVGTSAP